MEKIAVMFEYENGTFKLMEYDAIESLARLERQTTESIMDEICIEMGAVSYTVFKIPCLLS